ncbi:MAG TPA: glycosyltransferase [Chryseosolibacter sp.]|nr:glycosyltransferase [Chryseosolibacter sp.]
MNAAAIDRGMPLVSVVITTFNHAHFLRDAIESVSSQSYQPIDLIIVDDGSTDNTREVISHYPNIKYLFQRNAGLSAARNTGLRESNAEFIVFLDADDWLYRDAVEINVNYLLKNRGCAFVAGFHDKVDEWKYPIENESQVLIDNSHYKHFLRGNFIGMHATVMYRKAILDKYKFDEALRACEDYDVYFRISRDHTVGMHNNKLAAYRIHGNNMSSKIPFMLDNVLEVCRRQEKKLRNEEERAAYREGLRIWKEYYTERLYNVLMNDHSTKDFPSKHESTVLLRNKPFGFVKLSLKKTRNAVKSSLRDNLPDSVLKKLRDFGMFRHYTPKPGKVRPGDFERTTPFSYDFGFDRGGAVDRYYIEMFLRDNEMSIQGTVLEVGDNEYTLKFGGSRVLKSEILHVDASNEKATYVGDITDIPAIPDNHFDCIILTQTLHLIYDFRKAIQSCFRILKPGGSLLLTVPGISHIDHGLWRDYWLWSFTDKSIQKLLNENFNDSNVKIRTFGNVYVAAAFLYGMGLPELKEKELLIHDPSYQVIISAKATKHV